MRCETCRCGVRAGEIVGVAGVAGNGQRELAETISGMRSPSAGTVRSAGRTLRGGDPRSAIAAGVAHVPEDRLGTGLAPSLSITRNAVMKTYRSPPVSRGPAPAAAADGGDRALADHAATTSRRPGPETPARNLSGGNLQKLVLGREFQGEPARARRRPAHARPRRRRDRDRPCLPPRGGRRRRGGARDQRGPRRDPRARRPGRR